MPPRPIREGSPASGGLGLPYIRGRAPGRHPVYAASDRDADAAPDVLADADTDLAQADDSIEPPSEDGGSEIGEDTGSAADSVVDVGVDPSTVCLRDEPPPDCAGAACATSDRAAHYLELWWQAVIGLLDAPEEAVRGILEVIRAEVREGPTFVFLRDELAGRARDWFEALAPRRHQAGVQPAPCECAA